MSKITDAAVLIAQPICAAMDIELWDAEFVNEGGRQVLRLYIEAEGGVGIQQCEAVSRAVEPALDSADFYDGAYVLEVSSPGMERTLKKPGHFARYIGQQVDVRLFAPRDGKKSFVGTLAAYSPQAITLEYEGASIEFKPEEVSKVKLKPDYSIYF